MNEDQTFLSDNGGESASTELAHTNSGRDPT